MYLAEINSSNICIGIKQVNNFIDDGYHVEINKFSSDYIYRKYENSVWSEERFYLDIESKEPEPTNKEINDNLMVVMNGIVDIYMAQLGM